MKTKLAFATLAGLTLLFAACSKTDETIDDVLVTGNEIKSTELVTTPGDSCDFTATLTEDEVAGLLEMREEEKLAHDVYVTFYETYEYIIFNNISKSETAHTSAVLYLINGFGLADPALEGVGEFTSETFQALYPVLIETGNASLVDALKVGALIEETDIADLKLHLETTTNETILRVYGNLLNGSTFHLKAFSAVLARLGETYTPTVLSQEEYDEIISARANDEGSENDGITFVPGTGVCDGTGPNF